MKRDGPPRRVRRVDWSWGTKLLHCQGRGASRGEKGTKKIQVVLPDGAFEGFPPGVLQGADGKGVEVGAIKGVLVSPGPVEVARLEKPGEACVCAVPPEGGLVRAEEVFPVAAGGKVLVPVGRAA